MSASNQVSFSDISSGVMGAVFELPAIVKGATTLVRTKPDVKRSIGLVLEQNAADYPASPAVKFDDQVWTYASFNGWVNRVAAMLQAQGIGSGDVIAIISENRPETLACAAAAAKLWPPKGLAKRRGWRYACA